MSNEFFSFSMPRDLLEKAQRDLKILQMNPNIDTVFNYFVTAYHVVDYVKANDLAPESAIDGLYQEEDFRMCRFICNKGKHLSLRTGDEYDTYRRPGSTLGDFTLGETLLGVGEAYLVIGEEGQIDVVELAERIIDRWTRFFEEHEIK